MKHRLSLTAMALLFINGAGALYGGYFLMLDPSGERLQLPSSWLLNTAFRNFFIPCLLLFIVNGIFSFGVIAMIIFKYYKAPVFIFIEGCLLAGWIIIETLLTQMYDPLQVVM